MFSSTQIGVIQGGAVQAPEPSSARRGWRRGIALIAVLAAALVLGACGGGDDGRGGGTSGTANVNIGVTVGGQPTGQFFVAPGGAIDVVMRVNNSVILDAVEPVYWTMLVGGQAYGTGIEVFYAGAFIGTFALDSYAVEVYADAGFRFNSSIPITLVATSTFDSVQVARVNILITN